MKSRVFDLKLLQSHITFSSKHNFFDVASLHLALGLVLKKGVGNVRTAFGSPRMIMRFQRAQSSYSVFPGLLGKFTSEST